MQKGGFWNVDMCSSPAPGGIVFTCGIYGIIHHRSVPAEYEHSSSEHKIAFSSKTVPATLIKLE
jgi:hypothetical protein